MSAFRSSPTRRQSALVISYAFDVNVFSGLGDNHLREVSNLLRVHADRSQLAKVREEIDAVLQGELDLDHRVAHQSVLASIERLLPADVTIDSEVQRADADGVAPGRPQSPSGSVDKLIDHLQVLLGRVRDRRLPLDRPADIEQ